MLPSCVGEVREHNTKLCNHGILLWAYAYMHTVLINKSFTFGIAMHFVNYYYSKMTVLLE